MKYIMDKDYAEMMRQQELKRVKDQKERELMRMRDLQQKVADRQADIDAIRARRA
jgi:predicted  nucleic acid-binding Zn-ribbon protein